MTWISFGALPCRKKKKTWWQLESRCCWNRARPWLSTERVSFLVGLRSYRHPEYKYYIMINNGFFFCIYSKLRKRKEANFFYVLLTVHLSIFRAHVLETCRKHAFQPVLSQPVQEAATYGCEDTRGCVMQFWPPDDEHMSSKHVEAWNKLIVKQKFCASSWLITEIKKEATFLVSLL